MNIPKKLELAGLTIDICNSPTIKEENMIGQAAYAEQKIYLDFNLAPKDITEQAFWHELIHWIFFMMNEEELRQKEKLIDLMAHFLYQAVKSGKFETKEPYETEVQESEVRT